MRLMLLLCVGLALTVGVTTATADGGPGNSDAAKACQQGGWQKLVREDGTPFKNTGDCVSYAATTVGYGDIAPTSTEGRLIAIVVMVVGIAFLAVGSVGVWRCPVETVGNP
jgi:hypothetical protein